MNITEEKVNNIVVRPIKTEKKDERPVKGSELFNMLYANIYVNAKKRSGKTTTIFRIIKECVNKDTIVVVFCSTYLKDDNWIAIREYLDNHEIPNLFYHSIFDGKTNILKEFIEDEERFVEQMPDEEEEKDNFVLGFNETDDEIRIKKRKSKYATPKYFIIFDDLSDEIKNASIAMMVKKHRHILTKCLFSSQYVLDLNPQSRRQMDYLILFPGINEEKLKQIYDQSDLKPTLEQFIEIYKHATKDKYNFLYVDTNNSDFRRNFNSKLIYNS